jgi:hypothetical protein
MAIAVSKPYVERAIVLYGSWESDVRLTVSAESESSDPVRVRVLDQHNFENFLGGLSHNAVYDSGPSVLVEFSAPLPFIGGKDTVYYLVLQNPNAQSISTTYRASLGYEMAFLGYTYVEWLSRIMMPIAIVTALWIEAKNRNVTFSGIPGLFKHTAKLIANPPPIEPPTSKKEPTSSVLDSLGEIPVFAEHIIDSWKALGLPIVVTSLEAIVFNVDVDPGTIDLYVYEEPKFVELNSKEYFKLTRVSKIFNSSFSYTVHSARGLVWTPTKPGRYVIVLDNSANAIQKRCKLDYESSGQQDTGSTHYY